MLSQPSHSQKNPSESKIDLTGLSGQELLLAKKKIKYMSIAKRNAQVPSLLQKRASDFEFRKHAELFLTRCKAEGVSVPDAVTLTKMAFVDVSPNPSMMGVNMSGREVSDANSKGLLVKSVDKMVQGTPTEHLFGNGVSIVRSV